MSAPAPSSILVVNASPPRRQRWREIFQPFKSRVMPVMFQLNGAVSPDPPSNGGGFNGRSGQLVPIRRLANDRGLSCGFKECRLLSFFGLGRAKLRSPLYPQEQTVAS